MTDKKFNKDSIKNIVIVTLSLCIIASLLVSITAVSLSTLQEQNRIIEKRKNVLVAAAEVNYSDNLTFSQLEEKFKNVNIKVIDFKKGEVVKNKADYDPIKASKDPNQSQALSKNEDTIGIKRRENYGIIYEVNKGGQLNTLVLPIRGYGLWSTLYGFLALDKSGKKVKGITFYEHGETPGLGGEVDNVKWKKLWIDKTAYGDSGEILLKVLKGGKANPSSKTEVDGLSGATITTKGVDSMIQFWLSDDRGYGKYLKNYVFNK